MSVAASNGAATYAGAVIVVFAKAPHPGLVKTRMCPPFTPEDAAAFYANMLEDVLGATARFADHLGLSAIIAAYPPEACAEIASRAPKPYAVVAQRGHDLGARMAWAVAEAAASGASRILLRSSDSPMLDEAAVSATLRALDDFDLAICPDLDGGYALIGLHGPMAGLFEHPMSTQSVLDDTLANAQRLGLTAHLLDPSPDLDTAEDLLELANRRQTLEEQAPALCPATLRFLDEHALWPREVSRPR